MTEPTIITVRAALPPRAQATLTAAGPVDASPGTAQFQRPLFEPPSAWRLPSAYRTSNRQPEPPLTAIEAWLPWSARVGSAEKWGLAAIAPASVNVSSRSTERSLPRGRAASARFLCCKRYRLAGERRRSLDRGSLTCRAAKPRRRSGHSRRVAASQAPTAPAAGAVEAGRGEGEI